MWRQSGEPSPLQEEKACTKPYRSLKSWLWPVFRTRNAPVSNLGLVIGCPDSVPGYATTAAFSNLSNWLWPRHTSSGYSLASRPGFEPGSSDVGFVVDKVALGQVRFPVLIFIPPISPQSPSPIIWGLYNMPVVAAVPKVPPHKLKKKN
jgi:hypothetical protein